MEFFKYIFNPAILLIVSFFVFSVGYCVYKYHYINKELVKLLNFLKDFKKSNLTYRFKEFDEGLTSNPFISDVWVEFRNTLVFNENVALKNDKEEICYENATQTVSGIQTTVDSSYFFNEEALITSHLNYKYVQVTPTLLTGMGPLFTFMHIAFAFTHVDFTTNESTMLTIENLMANMQIAALCSVFAVGESLIFLFIERLMYNLKCKTPLNEIQNHLYKIFDSVTSEKFLIELLKTTKVQNHAIASSLRVISKNFKTAFDNSLAAILVPYLENIIHNLDEIRENSPKVAEKKALDAVDELF